MNLAAVKTKRQSTKHLQIGELEIDVTRLFRPRISDADFFDFCRKNDELRIEMTKEGDVIIMPPTTSDTGGRNFDFSVSFGIWVRQDKTSKGFNSSTGFTLPDGAKRSPDLSWIKFQRWNALTDAQKQVFAPICPDFVVEIRSKPTI